MAREFKRIDRVAEGIKRALGPMISAWIRDNHGGMASVLEADVSRDLKRARIFVSLYGVEDTDVALRELNEIQGRFRHELGQELRLRNLPTLAFFLDDSIAQGDKLSRMIDALNEPDD